ncbi:hypothetical protein MNBD_DELTA02-610 [hydrothermal vent metagenome]|uniref:Uncharacterized protein n=1 Tax=hydrothermal vent metagenome TaxID=652676 RepID=A0A3B0VDP9_9ZZZZ
MKIPVTGGAGKIRCSLLDIKMLLITLSGKEIR